MKKTIAILTLAGLAITSVNAGVHFSFNLGLPTPVLRVPAPVVVAPAPVVVAPAPVEVIPPMPAPIVEVASVCPAPGYLWVGGSWAWHDHRWVWNRGHWNPPARHYYAYNGGLHASHYGGFHHDRRHR